jgi:hypothetical protein
LRRIEDYDVETSFDEETETVSVGTTSTDSGGTEELFSVGLFRSERVILVLEQVRSGEECDESSFCVNDGQFTLLRVTEDSVGLFESRASTSSDEVGSLGHDGVEGSGVGSELDITTSDDADEFRSEFTGFCRREKKRELDRQFPDSSKSVVVSCSRRSERN